MEPNDMNTNPKEESSEDVLKSALASQSQQVSTNTVMMVVVAIAVVTLALMYVWVSNDATITPPPQTLPPVVEETPFVMPPVEDIGTIEAELSMPEIDILDADVTTLEAEIDQALTEE